jgi:hypothetical protein
VENTTSRWESYAGQELDIKVLKYAATSLPRAPAIVMGGETVVEGRDINEQELEKNHCPAPSGAKH